MAVLKPLSKIIFSVMDIFQRWPQIAGDNYSGFLSIQKQLNELSLLRDFTGRQTAKTDFIHHFTLMQLEERQASGMNNYLSGNQPEWRTFLWLCFEKHSVLKRLEMSAMVIILCSSLALMLERQG